MFDRVERFHAEGDHWVREWAAVGVLGALWPDDRFVPWLGPVSRVWWDRLRRFWSGDPIALHDGHGSSQQGPTSGVRCVHLQRLRVDLLPVGGRNSTRMGGKPDSGRAEVGLTRFATWPT